MIYAYLRISRKTQSIERQRTNVMREYPSAKIYEEAYTGTKTVGRKQWQKLLEEVRQGDTIVFDSVSRMSRNAEDGYKQYMELFDKGVSLVFLKEPHINTDTYKKAFNIDVDVKTDNKIVELALEFVKEALEILAQEQIEKAFEQAQKEVDDLRQRTKEGLREAKDNGKRVGQVKGATLTTKKSIAVKERMLEVVKEFGGYCDKEEDILKLLDVSRNTYYKYKRELRQELKDEGVIE